MPVVTGVQEDVLDLPPLALGSHKREHDLLNDDLRRKAVQAYFASITFMDAQVGKVLDALERLGLAENTIVVFTSDHGYHLGEHGLWQKMSLFEQSARVPLIMAGPGVKSSGTTAQSPVGLIDLYPTLTEMCSVKSPDNLQGQSLLPMLQDPDSKGRGWALSQVTRRLPAPNRTNVLGYTLRTERWRYTEWDEGRQGRELYDHSNDPLELTNLIEKDEVQGAVEELSQLMDEATANTYTTPGKIPSIRSNTWAPNLTHP